MRARGFFFCFFIICFCCLFSPYPSARPVVFACTFPLAYNSLHSKRVSQRRLGASHLFLIGRQCRFTFDSCHAQDKQDSKRAGKPEVCSVDARKARKLGSLGEHLTAQCICMTVCCLLVALRPSNMLVYVRDGSAQTSLRAATLR